MDGGRVFWNRVNVVLALFVLVMILLMLSMVSCGRVVSQQIIVPVGVGYEATNGNSTDWPIEAGGGVGAGKMNDLVRQSGGTYPHVTR